MLSTLGSKHLHLRDYLDIISRRRWPIITSLILLLGLLIAYLLLSPRIYRSDALILIEQSSARAFSIKEALAIDNSALDFYQTQYRLLESDVVSESVVRKLGLHKNPEFLDPPFGARRPADEAPLTEALAISKALKSFEKKRTITPIRQSRLVIISFESLDPRLAAKGANTIAQAYIDYTMDRKLQVSQAAVGFLTRRIEDQRRKLEASQVALQRYMEENQMATAISDNFGSITAEKLAELRAELVKVETQRKEAQARFNLATQAIKESRLAQTVPEILASPVFQAIRKRELEVSEKLAELGQRYGPNHPKMAGVKAEARAVRTDLNNEINRIVGSLENSYKVLLAKEKALRDALAGEQSSAMALRKKAIGYLVLKREVDTNQQLHDLLLTKSKEARIAEDIDVGTVSIVDPARVPNNPAKPRVMLILVIGGALSVLVAVGLGFLLEYMDNTVKFPDQVQDDLSLPFLGTVPHDAKINSGGKGKKREQEKILKAVSDLSSQTSEAFRTLRTAISLSQPGKPPQLLLVTSSSPSEGKSLVASFLASSYASAGVRTLLVDADLRKPRQHRLWGVSREVGITSLLSGIAKDEGVIHRNVRENLDVVVSGPIPPNPTELLQSKAMAQFLDTARKHYALIILDSPPMLPITDAAVLSHHADGTIVVVAAGKTPDFALKQTVERLQQAQGQILGVVLNKSDQRRGDYYYGGYRYKYYYQYEYGRQGEKGGSRRGAKA